MPELTPDAPASLIRQITALQGAIKSMQAELDECKAGLQAHYDNGDIPDKLSTPYGSATLTQRSTWAYSSAVRQLQELEQLEGIATKKVSSSWTIRPAATEQPDF